MADLVFLGAGASRPFDIPTMQEMVTEFENKIKDEDVDLFNYYSDIKKTLIDTFGSSNVDIEAMFSVLEGISRDVDSKDLGHFASYYISKSGSRKPFDSNDIDKAKKLLERLKGYIKDSCTVKLSSSKSTEVYEMSYVPLFSIVKARRIQTFHAKYKLPIGWKAFTTNYDDVFENFWNSLQEPTDHFDKQGASDNYVFNPNKLDLGEHSFVKLHGSLDWTLNKENGSVIRKKIASFQPFQTGGDVMLFPIQQKDLYLSPWHALFQDFRIGLMHSERWYVVGYAFNDEFIRNAFIEQLKLRIKPTLVIIGPSSKQIIEKFPQDLREKIIALPIKFGSKYFSKQIHDFAANVRTLKILVKTASSSIGFKSSIPTKVGLITKLEGVHTLPNMQANAAGTWIETSSNLPPGVKEVEFDLQIAHEPPYDKDLELQVGFSIMCDYSFEVYIQDHLLNSKSGHTAILDQDLGKHLSDTISIPSSSLFISS